MKAIQIISLLLSFSAAVGQDFDIERLEGAFKNLNSDKSSIEAQMEYMEAFPGSFEDFLLVFGYENDKPAPLYFEAHDYVPLLFKLDNLLLEEVMEKWINISIGGKWQADAVNYFQHELRPMIYKYPELSYATLKKYSNEDVESFFYFLFNEPYPKENIPKELSSYKSKDAEYYSCIVRGHKKALGRNN